MSDETAVDLDDYARGQLEAYKDASARMAVDEERKAKARDALLAFLTAAGANVGTVDGAKAVTLVDSEYEALDAPALRAAEPSTFRRYAVIKRRTYIRAA